MLTTSTTILYACLPVPFTYPPLTSRSQQKEAPPAAAVNGTQLTILGPMQPRAAEPQMVNSGLGLPYANMFHASAQPIMAQPGAEAPMALAGVFFVLKRRRRGHVLKRNCMAKQNAPSD